MNSYLERSSALLLAAAASAANVPFTLALAHRQVRDAEKIAAAPPQPTAATTSVASLKALWR